MLKRVVFTAMAISVLNTAPALAAATYVAFGKYGYTEKSHGRDRYSVSYFGKADTAADGVTNELVLRLARLCRKKGFDQYKITDHKQDTAYKNYLSGNMRNMDKAKMYPYEYVAAYCLKDAEAESLSVEETITSLSKLVAPAN